MLAFSAWAGQRSGPVTLARIEVAGAKRFPPAKIIAASGLRRGQTVREADLQAAVNRLGGTGAFTEVSYQYRVDRDGMTATLNVKEASRFLVCDFDNFV